MARQVKNRNGRVITLLNPSEKGAKYASELRSGFPKTNDGRPKLDKNNSQSRLTKEQRAYRSGYLDAQRDSAKAWKYNQKKR